MLKDIFTGILPTKYCSLVALGAPIVFSRQSKASMNALDRCMATRGSCTQSVPKGEEATMTRETNRWNSIIIPLSHPSNVSKSYSETIFVLFIWLLQPVLLRCTWMASAASMQSFYNPQSPTGLALLLLLVNALFEPYTVGCMRDASNEFGFPGDVATQDCVGPPLVPNGTHNNGMLHIIKSHQKPFHFSLYISRIQIYYCMM